MSKPQISVDIAIIGGGIAGLWTLSRLRQLGYQAILLEKDQLGCQQTGASQGIIHGGTKYALTGKLTNSSQSIQKMPQRWKDCLEGTGEVDLTQAKKLSDYQYLWANQNLGSKLTGFFASKVMSSRMKSLDRKVFQAPFNDKKFKGNVYQLDEPVLDTQSVINSLKDKYKDHIYNFSIIEISKEINKDQKIKQYILSNKDQLSIKAKLLILTAGSGNQDLLNMLNLSQPKMQKRPLYMPMLKVKASQLPLLYAHCLGMSALPKMTITSHQFACPKTNALNTVWYLGGDIAEKGVGRSLEQQVKAAQKELYSLMPWMNFSFGQWSALKIDRAEPIMEDKSRPSEPAVFLDGLDKNVITAWPVKLAMTPIMVDKILSQIQHLGIQENNNSIDTEDLLSLAKISKMPWELETRWI